MQECARKGNFTGEATRPINQAEVSLQCTLLKVTGNASFLLLPEASWTPVKKQSIESPAVEILLHFKTISPSQIKAKQRKIYVSFKTLIPFTGIHRGPSPEGNVPYFVGKTSSSVTSFCTELMTKSTY